MLPPPWGQGAASHASQKLLTIGQSHHNKNNTFLECLLCAEVSALGLLSYLILIETYEVRQSAFTFSLKATQGSRR